METVQPSLSNVSRRSFRDRGASAIGRVVLVVLLGVAGLAVFSAAPPAAALPADAPAPPPPAPALAIAIDPVPPFSPLNTLQLSGTKDAGSTVTVQPIAPNTTAPCPPISSADTTWSCLATLPNGPGVVLTAVETLGGDTAQAQTRPFDVLGPPTIDGLPDLLTTGLVSGGGYPGSTVTTAIAGAPDCSSLVSDSGYWSCSLTVPSGDWSVTATQSRADIGGGQPSSVSGSLDVVVDKDAPAPPVVTSPRSGSRVSTGTVTYRGTGEDGGTVDLYVDNVPVCSATVGGTAWSCVAAAPASGTHSVLAVQRDAAGNFSSPSPAIRAIFGPAPAAGAVPPSPTPSAPSPTPATPEPAPAIPPFNVAPPKDPPHTGWDTPTAFGSTMPTLASSIADGNWISAPLIAVAFLLLIALPLRLLAIAMHGRLRRPRMRFMGRNQAIIAEQETDAPQPANPWLAGLVPLAVATALIVISGGLNDELRYLRLSVTVALGVAILNIVGVALPARLAARREGTGGQQRLVVVLLLAAAITALLSRVTGIQPPVVTGVLIGMGFARGLPARARGMVRLVEVASVAALGVAAWIAHGLLVDASGFLPVASRELLATVALAGLGSALVMVLPIGDLPGRTMLEWSVPVWIVTVFVVATIAAGVFLGGAAPFPMVGSLAVAASFAALSLAVWSWFRFVEPSMGR